jgi:predicted Zn-ribbon and HTH transcriptional regulator
MIKLSCKNCGHCWIPRIKDPLECPHCKSRHWKEEDNEKRERA